jgi:tRNA(fMet)-specific endonuclease VapC
MAVLVDTSVFVHAERGDGSLDRTDGDERRAVSVITASELLHGVHRATSEPLRTQRLAFVEHVIARFQPLPVTTQIARIHAETRAQLQRAGTPIDAHDLWIAATALAHGLGIATRNVRHFERVPGLRVVVA